MQYNIFVQVASPFGFKIIRKRKYRLELKNYIFNYHFNELLTLPINNFGKYFSCYVDGDPDCLDEELTPSDQWQS